jgi:hypothetical protein
MTARMSPALLLLKLLEGAGCVVCVGKGPEDPPRSHVRQPRLYVPLELLVESVAYDHNLWPQHYCATFYGGFEDIAEPEAERLAGAGRHGDLVVAADLGE